MSSRRAVDPNTITHPGCHHRKAAATKAKMQAGRKEGSAATRGATAKETVKEGFTHGDVFEEVAAFMGTQPVTPRDAAAIEAAEAKARGPAHPGSTLGAAAQSAAAHNIQRGAIKKTDEGWVPEPERDPKTLGDVLKDAKHKLPWDKVVAGRDAARVQRAEHRQSAPGEEDKFGMGAVERNTVDYNYSMREEQHKGPHRPGGRPMGAGQPVAAAPEPGTTVGDALEDVAKERGALPVTPTDAAAIQAAASAATWQAGRHGRLTEEARTAAEKNVEHRDVEETASGYFAIPGAGATLGEVLEDAKKKLPDDSVVAPKDASNVQSAEAMANPITGATVEGGVAAHLQAAADKNVSAAQQQSR